MKGTLNTKLKRLSLTLDKGLSSIVQVQERPEGYFTFLGGSLHLNKEGCVIGSILVNQKKYFFSGDSLDEFEVRPRKYAECNLQPYRGIKVEGGILVRLLEPTIYRVSEKDLEKGYTSIKGVNYTLEEKPSPTLIGHSISVTPISYYATKVRFTD